MKSQLLISLLFFSLFNSQKIDSSRIECKYLTTFLVDTTDTNSKKIEMTSLLIGDQVSLFRSDAKSKFDSLAKKNIDQSFKAGGNIVVDFSNIPKAFFTQEVLYKMGKSTVYDKILKNGFAFEPENKITWKLINETKNISTYSCKKAIGKYGKRTIIAWYTSDLPIQEGPYNFKGLPGLIIEAYDDKDFFHFTLQSLKKIVKPIIPVQNYLKTDYTKFSKQRENFKNDPIGAFFVATGRSISKEQQDRIIKLHRSKNNYLD
ncbi:GLPGLI family protein [Chryseobacterium sp. C39-AII1]|uniref:GLPGLI family protein n=1 Tax=Chryseobacterium sp. C39-AII1 TaxID=3080332 RepID=UPI003208E4CA